MLRRLYDEQPESFAFTPANLEWAKGQIAKYPEGRQASAVIPLLWRAQEQEGWVSRPAIEEIAKMLGMASIRVLEVATFYFMFQLRPVGTVAHVQVCGTTSCMICGAEDLMAVCKEKIAAHPHELSADGKFSWEEVECLGSCANAPMAQIGKDYYEDLTAESFGALLDALARGEVPVPGSQTGRFSSEPAGGRTSLKDGDPAYEGNSSVSLAVFGQDTVKRITGDEPALRMPEAEGAVAEAEPEAAPAPEPEAAPAAPAPAMEEPVAAAAGEPTDPEPVEEGSKPPTLVAPRDGQPDDLKKIKGIGPKLEQLLHSLGYYHFDQIAAWTGAEVAWVDANLEGFRGRVTRDEWVAQAKVLAGGGDTEFSERVDKGDVY